MLVQRRGDNTTDACAARSLRGPRLRRLILTLLLGGAYGCGYIGYDYLPVASEEPEVAERAEAVTELLPTAEGTETSTTPLSSTDDAPAPTSTPTVSVSLTLTPGTNAIQLDLAGDTLPAGYTYNVERSTLVTPASPGDGDVVCTDCPASVLDSSLSSFLDHMYAVFIYDDLGALVETLTASALPDGTWSASSTQLSYLKPDNLEDSDWFGHGVALSSNGSLLATSSVSEDSNATGIDGDGSNNGALNSGAVYIHRRSGTSWTQEAYIKASNTSDSDEFGDLIALSADGTTLAVSAPGEDSGGSGVDGATAGIAGNSGAVYVFRRDGMTWTQQAFIKAPIEYASLNFGQSLALSADGNTLAVGTGLEDSSTTGVGGNMNLTDANASGAVYLYARSGATWSFDAYIKASNTGANDRFGSALALSGEGDTLAVGAHQESSNSPGIDGDQLNDGALSSGATYVFQRTSGVWAQEAYVKATDVDNFDFCGRDVALSFTGDVLAMSCTGDASPDTGISADVSLGGSTNAGAVYIVERSGNTWAHATYIKASTVDAFDSFGNSIALNDEGNVLVVGAVGEDSSATGINGNEGANDLTLSGAVYVFERNVTWSQRAYVKADNAGDSDFFGSEVALSGNGAMFAVGVYAEDDSSTAGGGLLDDVSSAGAAYIFAR